MDFLGLRNLDVITDAVAMIRAGKDPIVRHRHRRRSTTTRRSPCCAAATRSACSSSRAARCGRSCARSPPTTFDDVAALVALYRPGPDERQHAQRLRRSQERPQAGRLLPRGCRRAAGRHLRPDDLPGDGHAGVAQKFAGYSLAEADNLRKAMRQEDPLAHGAGAREVRRRLRARPATASRSASSCSTRSSRSPTTRSTRATPSATASSPTRPRTSRRTTRSSTSPVC